jgi:5-(carboxyamino)imidazole ribonucleotide mutase
MGSQSDWATMTHCVELLKQFKIPFEVKVVSAHRTPALLYKYTSQAAGRGLKIIIAAAGGAAHLPGMAAAITELPVIGVPIQSRALKGIDSLLSIAQMPAGIPVATVAIGEAGAKNSAILAAQILALEDRSLATTVKKFRAAQTKKVLRNPDPRKKAR